MIKIVSLVTAAAALLSACATAPPSVVGPLAVVNSPVSFDGDIAGKPTDLVFVLVPDANPRTPGVVLRAGESLRLALPRGSLPARGGTDRRQQLSLHHQSHHAIASITP